LQQALAGHPLDASLHLELARTYLDLERFHAAVGTARTGLALGYEGTDGVRLLQRAYAGAGLGRLARDAGVTADPRSDPADADEGTLDLPPVVYHRLRAIAARCRAVAAEASLRILDVGGGEGQLAAFLPDTAYCLAEPTINGLEASAFAARTDFDVVVACHVLEHVPDEAKEAFLGDLCDLARRRVILLGPVSDDPTGPAIDALVHRITGADWAAEHLACGRPSLGMLRHFAETRGYGAEATPHGDQAATFWMIFAEHFADDPVKRDRLRELNRFSNEHFHDRLSHPEQPNDYLVELVVG
jgi:hypothetical protein